MIKPNKKKTDLIFLTNKIPVSALFDDALMIIASPLRKVNKSDLKTCRSIVSKFFKDLDYIVNHMEGENINLQTELPPRYEVSPRT